MNRGLLVACAIAVLAMCPMLLSGAETAGQESATVEFDPAVLQAWDAARYPAWVERAGTEDGTPDAASHSWAADSSLPEGRGQCWIDISRTHLVDDLALTLVFEAQEGSDVAVQLWDSNNQVVAVDLFMNVIEATRDLKTPTFIVPMQKYPTARRIVIRRVSGSVRVFSAVLTPVVGEAPADLSELLELARRLGDPMSEDSPLVRAARQAFSRMGTNHVAGAGSDAATALRFAQGRLPELSPKGLVAYYDFDDPLPSAGSVKDRSGNGADLGFVGKVPVSAPGVFGRGVLLDGGFLQGHTNVLAGADAFTFSLWFKTASPENNYKLASGSWWRGGPAASGWVIGTHYPEFWADGGEGSLRQDTPGWERKVPLQRGAWNHLVVRYDREQIREYVNGQVAVECPATGRRLGYGAAMQVGAWMFGFQFHGLMDDFRIYSRALDENEIKALYEAAGDLSTR